MVVDEGGGKKSRLSSRLDAEDVGAGVEDLGPLSPDGDLDSDLCLDFDLAFFPLEVVFAEEEAC